MAYMRNMRNGEIEGAKMTLKIINGILHFNT